MSISIVAKKASAKIFDFFFELKEIDEDKVDCELNEKKYARVGSFSKEPPISQYELSDTDIKAGDTIAIITGYLWSYSLLYVTDITKFEISGLSIRPSHNAIREKNQLQFFAKQDLRLNRNPMNYRWSEDGFVIHERNLLSLLNNMGRKLQFCEDVKNPNLKTKLYAFRMRSSLRKNVI